jgi:AraC family transcriptional regulator of adaptative response / methylphosphotriester-DNA alkyltransferase methyltransferase
VRMQKALELLREGSLPVRDVAASVGYRQAAQFAKTFRRHHGRPPSSIRRERYSSPTQPSDGSGPSTHTLGFDRAAAA